MDARKTRLAQADALALLKDVDEVYASKGKKLVHLNLRESQPDPAALAAVLLGPTGNLRAPTLRVGRTLLVGFDEPTFRSVFK